MLVRGDEETAAAACSLSLSFAKRADCPSPLMHGIVGREGRKLAGFRCKLGRTKVSFRACMAVFSRWLVGRIDSCGRRDALSPMLFRRSGVEDPEAEVEPAVVGYM
jgi:hypothetical protein